MVEKEYAQALLELASEQNKLTKITSEIEAVLKLLKNNDFKLFMESPSIQINEKKKVLKNSLIDFNDVTLNFLYVLLDNRRFYCLENIYKNYKELMLKGKKTTNVTLHSQVKLTKAQIEKLKAPIEARLNSKNIVIENIVDPTLIGGIVIYADNTRIDLSTKGILNDLKESL